VDTADLLIAEFSCQRPIRRWPVKLFLQVVDMACLNSYLTWTDINPEFLERKKSPRRKFIRELVESLIIPHIHHWPWDSGILSKSKTIGAFCI
jgi:hypothetical protein